MKKMLTPAELCTKSNCQEVSHDYDWNKQAAKNDICKAGTAYSTGTNTFGGRGIEDYNAD